MDKQAAAALASAIEGNLDSVLSKWFEHQFDAQLTEKWNISGAQNADQGHMTACYLTPLIRLLLAYLKSGDSTYLYGYLDERLRYAPHREPAEIRAQFFEGVINKDTETLLETLPQADGQRNGAAALLKQLHAPLTEVPSKAPISMLTLGDCLMNELRVFLPHMARQADVPLDMRGIYFSARFGGSVTAGQSLDLTEITDFLAANKVDVVAVSTMSYEALPIYVMLLKECESLSNDEIDGRVGMIVELTANMLKALREQTDAPFLVHNASGLPLTRYRKHIPFLPVFSGAKRRVLDALNERMAMLVPTIQNTLLIDEHSVAAKHGVRKCSRAVFPKSITDGGMLHTANLGLFLSPAYLNILEAYKRLAKCKALMLDFDNTLWQGVMADGDVEHFAERQALLRKLKDMGILLVAVSKNTMENIRWDEMILKEDDFVLHKINWDLKVNSIAAAVSELNIGMDTIVFIDDNPVELDMVRQELDGITVCDATDERVWQQLELMQHFPNTLETEESKQRTEMYRQSFERKQSLNQQNYDYPKLMASLALKVEFRQAKASDMERIYELVNRTNQFNTTTIRYSKEELQSMMADDKYTLWTASLADKFGSLGVVLVVILEYTDDAAIIDSFIMSCRAMGFTLEDQILHLLTDQSRLQRDALIGRYQETDRNTPCAALFKNNHFSDAGNGEWRYQLGESEAIGAVAWIEMV